MANPDIGVGSLLPEIDPTDVSVSEPDRLVVLVANRVGMPEAGQSRTGRSDQREQERSRRTLAKLVTDAFDSVWAVSPTDTLMRRGLAAFDSPNA